MTEKDHVVHSILNVWRAIGFSEPFLSDLRIALYRMTLKELWDLVDRVKAYKLMD